MSVTGESALPFTLIVSAASSKYEPQIPARLVVISYRASSGISSRKQKKHVRGNSGFVTNPNPALASDSPFDPLLNNQLHLNEVLAIDHLFVSNVPLPKIQSHSLSIYLLAQAGAALALFRD